MIAPYAKEPLKSTSTEEALIKNLPRSVWGYIFSFEKLGNLPHLARLSKSFAALIRQPDSWNAPYQMTRLLATCRIQKFSPPEKRSLRISKMAQYGDSYAYVQDGLIRILSPSSLHKHQQLSFASGVPLALWLTKDLVVAVMEEAKEKTFYAICRESDRVTQLNFKEKSWTYDPEKMTFCHYNRKVKAIQVYSFLPPCNSEQLPYLFTEIPLFCSPTALAASERILYVALPGTLIAFNLTPTPPSQKNVSFGNSLTIQQIFVTKQSLVLISRPAKGKRELTLLKKSTLSNDQQVKMRFKTPQHIHVDNKQIVIWHDGGHLERREPSTGNVTRRMRFSFDIDKFLKKKAFPFAVKGNLAVLGSTSGFEVWNLKKGTELLRVDNLPGTPIALDFCQNGSSLAIQTNKGELLVWHKSAKWPEKRKLSLLSVEFSELNIRSDRKFRA